MDTLFLTNPMMHGPAVKRLQEMGDLLGFDRGPNDGIYGKDSELVVRDIQAKLGLKVDGVCGPATWAAILLAVEALDSPTPYPVIDRRGQHPQPKLYGGRQRAWSDITGVPLHQTGCAMPTTPSGWDRLNAHIGVTSEGKVLLVNDPTDFIWHAQGLSLRTIGIEIAGNYAGIEGNLRTVWRGGGGPHHVTPQILSGLTSLFGWLRFEFSRNGATWVEVHAHRQSSKDRPSDPGSALWQQVGMPWLRALQAPAGDGGPHWYTGTGRPVPREWNSAYPTRYWA